MITVTVKHLNPFSMYHSNVAKLWRNCGECGKTEKTYKKARNLRAFSFGIQSKLFLFGFFFRNGGAQDVA